MIDCDDYVGENGSDDEIVITLYDSEAKVIKGADVTVDINGPKSYTTDNRDQIKVPVSELQAGSYNALILFEGNENYSLSYKKVSISITDSTVLDITVSANEASYGEDTIITIVAKDGSASLVALNAVNITIGNVTQEYPVYENGNVKISGLNAGETEITVSVDDGVHKAASEKIIVKVKQATDVQIILDFPMYCTYLDDFYVNITVIDGKGNLINTTVMTQVDGNIQTPYFKIVNGKGTAPLNGHRPGFHLGGVILLDSNYLDTATYKPFFIEKAPTTVIVRANSIKESENVIVEVWTYNANYIEGYTVITVNDVDYSVKTDYLGYGILDIKDLPAGNYSVIAKFIGDEFNDEGYGETSFTVSEYNNVTVKMIGGEGSIILSFTDSKGRAVNGNVNVTINGEIKYYTITDGKVIITDLSSGEKEVTVNYPGDDTHPPITLTQTVFVSKGKLSSKISYNNMTTTAVDVDTDGRVGEYFTITLTDSEGKALANKFVQIGFNGNVYNRTTDNDGKAKLQINLKNAGTYTFANAS